MRIHIAFTSAFLLSVFAGYALHAQGARQRPVFGSGRDLCGTWGAARATANATRDSRITQAALFEEWLRGFVSAFAAANPTLKQTDSKAIAAFVDTYCRQHPRVQLYDAAVALTRELASAP
jgi:hypothetical protein